MRSTGYFEEVDRRLQGQRGWRGKNLLNCLNVRGEDGARTDQVPEPKTARGPLQCECRTRREHRSGARAKHGACVQAQPLRHAGKAVAAHTFGIWKARRNTVYQRLQPG